MQTIGFIQIRHEGQEFSVDHDLYTSILERLVSENFVKFLFRESSFNMKSGRRGWVGYTLRGLLKFILVSCVEK